MSKNRNKLALQNRFEILSDLEDETANDDRNNHEDNTKKKNVKIPPISITNTAYSIEFLKRIIDTNVTFKKTSFATKIFNNSVESYNSCIESLKQQKIDFYTHPIHNMKLFKVVLYGLPKTEHSVIKDELKAFNCEPEAIKEIQTISADENHRIFLLSFPKGTVTMNCLKSIRSINHIMIHWKPFVPKRSDKKVTQCYNCLMFGHGGSNCYRVKQCGNCASVGHNSSECPSLSKSAEFVKCFNCIQKKYTNINHRANDVSCPCRKKFIAQREQYSQYNQQSTNNANLHRNVATKPNPPIIIPKNPPSTSTWPRPTIQGNPIQINKNDNDELFSTEDLFKIFSQTVNELRLCKNKLDQLTVIMNLLNHAI